MQSEIKSWIYAARLRTLPLSLSGIVLSALIAHSRGYNAGLVFIIASLTTLSLQILANFANDYGDGIKGTDNTFRIGPERTVQSGRISPRSMKKALYLLATLCFFLGMLLIYLSFKTYRAPAPRIFIFVIFTCLYAAIKYTVGQDAYGYKGRGDLYVFLFFGLIAVQGSYFLYTHRFEWDVLLLAAAMGLLSMAVLNLNNMRDIHSDYNSGKYTFVVQIGLDKAKVYHIFLVLFPFVLGSLFVKLNQHQMIYRWAFLVLLIPIFFHLKKIFSINDLKKLDPELKKIALITLLYALIIGLGQVF